jgi:hypothetical protein
LITLGAFRTRHYCWQCRGTGDLGELFVKCSSTAFGLASPPVSPGSIQARHCRQRKTNPAPSLSPCEACDPRSPRRAICPAITKLGPVDTAGHPLMNVDVAENFFLFPGFRDSIPKNHSQKNCSKNPGLMYSLIVLADCQPDPLNRQILGFPD